ncbi:hypothetical protein NDU88_003934 [Pleurodeles waltl]|uniref:Uncharacterized protein n=1 Tax=Pleurodeles waltl TaxID=8319 RepID=A0AAV7W3J9_PLEWA|nr:hypothetical protein NDU88_003934 [Pleurodeles waltl]
MDQFTAPNTGGGPLLEPSRASGGPCEPSRAQILAPFEAYEQAVQAQIAAMAQDVNLMKLDLRAAEERSIAPEQQGPGTRASALCWDSYYLGRDLNCILNGSLDRCLPKQGTKPRMTTRLHKTMARLHFVDVLRDLHPASKMYSCYKPAHGPYRRLDRFLLANDGTLKLQKAAYQVRFLSDHAPLLLECEISTHRAVISLWRLRPETLGDPEYRADVLAALYGYICVNWNTAQTRGLEWGALKVVIRGESLGKSNEMRMKLEREHT